MPTSKVVQLITAERQRQTAKWGKQGHTDGFWLIILLEELGEASRAMIECDHLSVVEELVQAAAVIVAWLEDKLEKGGL